MAESTGATSWNYRVRRMEIAWEMAQKLALHYSGDNQQMNTNNMEQAMKDAWRIVDEVLPR